MSNCKTKLFLFPTLIFSAVLSMVLPSIANAQVRECAALFTSQGAEEASLVSQALIEPAIAAYRKILDEKTQLTPKAEVTDENTAFRRMIGGVLSQAVRAARVRPEPRMQTGSDEYMVRPRTRAERFSQMLSEAQAQYERQRRRQTSMDPVAETFGSIQKDRVRTGEMTQAEFDHVFMRPVDFAIVYAQTHGIVAYAGDGGMTLSRHIPWTTFVSPTAFASLRDVARMARALNSNPEQRRAADNLVLEVLRVEFAPAGFDFQLDVGVGN